MKKPGAAIKWATGTKIIMITVFTLAALVIVFAFLNRNSVMEKKEARQSGTFYIRINDNEHIVTMNDMEALAPFDITADYKISGREPEKKTYQGVSLAAVVESLAIDYSGCESVTFTAADGYVSILPIAEALDSEKCFIVVALENELLGTKESGGSGPFMMILPNDPFSQRWCKFLLEVRLK